MSSVLDQAPKRAAKRRLSLEDLRRELRDLRQRVEDLEDLRELNQAIERNGSKPLVSWSKARKELGLD
jgi:hypothetical protein